MPAGWHRADRHRGLPTRFAVLGRREFSGGAGGAWPSAPDTQRTVNHSNNHLKSHSLERVDLMNANIINLRLRQLSLVLLAAAWALFVTASPSQAQESAGRSRI